MSLPVLLQTQPETVSRALGDASGASSQVVLRQSVSVFLTQVALLLCGVLNSFLVAYVVGPEGRGLIYLLQVIAGGAGLTLLNFGLGTAAVFYLGRGVDYALSEIASAVLWSSLFLGVLPLAGLAFLWPWLSVWSTQKLSGGYLWLALAMIAPMNLTLNVGFLCLGRKRIRDYNWLRVAPSLLFLFSLLVVLFMHDRKIWTVALVWATSTVIPGVFAFDVIRNAGGMRWLAGTNNFLRSAFRFGWHSHLGAVTQYFQHRSDIFLVSFFLPVRDLGLYAFAVSLAELLWYVPHAVGTVLMSHIASNPDEAVPVTPLVCRATFALTAVFSFGLAAASTLLIPWVLPAFRVSVKVLWILLPGVVAASLFKVLANDFNGRGRPIETFYPALIALGGGLVFGILMIPRYGIFGAALVTTWGYLLNAWLYLRAYMRMTSVPIGTLLFLSFDDLTLARAALHQEWKTRFGN